MTPTDPNGRVRIAQNGRIGQCPQQLLPYLSVRAGNQNPH